MNTSTMQDSLTDEETDLLVEIAHMALDLQRFEQFDALINAIVRLRPDKPYPQIAVALGLYVRGQADQAIAALHEVLGQFPDAIFTRSLLARFIKEAGGSGWEAYARQALQLSTEGVAADMAREALGEELQEDADGQNAGSLMVSMRGLRA